MPISGLCGCFKCAAAPALISGGCFFSFSAQCTGKASSGLKWCRVTNWLYRCCLLCLERGAGCCHCHWGGEWFGGTGAGGQGGKPCPRTCSCRPVWCPSAAIEAAIPVFEGCPWLSSGLPLSKHSLSDPLHKSCGFTTWQNSPYTDVFSENSPLWKKKIKISCPKL